MFFRRLVFRLVLAVVVPLMLVWVLALFLSDAKGRTRALQAEEQSLGELCATQKEFLTEALGTRPAAARGLSPAASAAALRPLAPAALAPLALSPMELQRWAERFYRSTDAAGVFLLDPAGNTVATRGSSLQAMAALPLDDQAHDDLALQGHWFKHEKGLEGAQGLLHYAEPIHSANGALLGYLELDRNDERIESAVRLYVHQMALEVALLIVFEIAFLLPWLYLLVANPLFKLLTTFRGAVQGRETDLTRRCALKGSVEMEALASVFNEFMGRSQALVEAMLGHADSLAEKAQNLKAAVAESNEASREIASAVQQIAQGATDQAGRVGEINQLIQDNQSSFNEVKARADETMQSADQARSSAQASLEMATRTESSIQKLNAAIEQSARTMQELGLDSQQIGTVVDIITVIADQTNLLSLNAAIEAARAGEQGRGFSVVAAEVRKLAEQAGNATAEIGDLIHKVQKETLAAVRTMEEGSATTRTSSEVIAEVARSVQVIHSVVAEVEKRSRSIIEMVDAQTERAHRIVKGIEEIATVSEETAASTEEASASTEEHTSSMEEMALAAESMAILARELHQKAQSFKVR